MSVSKLAIQDATKVINMYKFVPLVLLVLISVTQICVFGGNNMYRMLLFAGGEF